MSKRDYQNHPYYGIAPGLGFESVVGVDSTVVNAAMASPEGAAAYLYSQNKSLFTNLDEAALAVNVLEKAAANTNDAKRFAVKWRALNGWEAPIVLTGSGLGTFSNYQNIIKNYGIKIYLLVAENVVSNTPNTVAQTTNTDVFNTVDQINNAKGQLDGILKTMKTTDVVSVRSSPEILTTNKLGKLSAGATVNISDKNTNPITDWARIIYNGKVAYVAAKYLKDIAAAKKTSSSNTSSKTATTPDKTAIAATETPTSLLDKLTNLTVVQKSLIVGGVVTVAGLIMFLTRKK